MKTITHRHDIDIIKILNLINHPDGDHVVKFYSRKKHKEFFEQYKMVASDFLNVSSIELEELMSRNVSKVIIPSRKNSIYPSWLGLYLSLVNPDRIPLILNYHWKKVKQASWFINHVHYRVYSSIQSSKYYDIKTHIQKILEWTKLQSEKLILPKGERAMNMQPSIKIVPKNLELVYELLRVSVIDVKRSDDLLRILKGGQISKPIKLSCKRNYFTLVLSKAIDKEYVLTHKLELSYWIHSYFLFLSPHSRKFIPASQPSLLKVLYGQKDLSPRLQVQLAHIF